MGGEDLPRQVPEADAEELLKHLLRAAGAVAVLLALGAAGCAAGAPSAGPGHQRARARPVQADAYAAGYQAAFKGNQGGALVTAAASGRLDVVRSLLTSGVDPNSRNEAGSLALAQAAAKGYTQIAEALLDAGARTTEPEGDKDKTMPVMLAFLYGHPDTARLLIRRGAKLSAKANNGRSALDWAIGAGQLEMVQSALDLGADPNEVDPHGDTPVHHATRANRPDMVKALIAAGGVPVGVLGRVGLGLAADAQGALVADSLVPGGPAAASGMRKGDKILTIDGKDALQLTVAQAFDLLRGAPDTTVEIGVDRGGNPVVFKLLRQRVGTDGGTAERTAPAAAAPAPEASASKTAASDVDSPKRRGPERPDDFALVVGIEKYSRLPVARFAENDADAMKRHLLALGYPERNIILLKGGQATRGALQGYVEEWLPRNAKTESQVFFYFSGHGSPDPKTGDAYIVPWDGDAMFLKSTAYPLKALYASLGRLKAKRVLVALDSCFSGAGGRSVLADGARPLVSHVDDASAPAGVTVLSAASDDEITGTIDAQGHGAFTYYLLKALNDGKLTAKAAYGALKPRVQDEAHRQNREQTPLLLGDDASF